MKRTIAVATALLFAASLSACGGGSAQGPASTSPAAETSTASSSPSKTPKHASTAPAKASSEASESASMLTPHQQVYLAQLRKAHASLLTAPDDGLIGIGEGVCTFYDNGATSAEVNDFLLIGAGVAYTVAEFAAMHGAAVAAFCPEYMAQLSSGQ